MKLLLVFVEYSESNAPLLIVAITSADTKRGRNDQLLLCTTHCDCSCLSSD